MKSYTTQQEVVLVTGTHFASQQYQRNHSKKKNNSTPIDCLKEACWDGLLPEILPEAFLMEKKEANNLFMWQIREAEGFISIELGEYPEPLDYFYSIDPNSFLEYWSES